MFIWGGIEGLIKIYKVDTTFKLDNEKCLDFLYKFDNCHEFLLNFRKQYKYVCAYHATKISLEEKHSILNHGLILPTRLFLTKKAISRFVDKADPFNLQQEVTSFIEKHYQEVQLEQSIFFTLDKDSIEKCTQYLRYGSETMLPLAYKLENQFKAISFRQKMINHGSPAVVIVKIPLNFVSDYDIEMIYKWDQATEVVIELKVPLSKENIVNIELQKEPIGLFL